MSEGQANLADDGIHATASGNAPAFNIILGTDALRPVLHIAAIMFAASLLLCVGAVIMTVWGSTYLMSHSDAQVQRAEDKIEEANINLRQNWYWSSQVYAEALVLGLKISPPPKPVTIKTGIKKS